MNGTPGKQRLESAPNAKAHIGTQGELTQVELKKALTYHPKTGNFFWKINGNNQFVKKGFMAGSINNQGHRTIMVNRKRHPAKTLAYLYMEGVLPEHAIIYKNGNTHDDRWKNLLHTPLSIKAALGKECPLTQETLKKILHYSPGTGKWSWLVYANTNKAKIGCSAGCLASDGYVYIRINRKLYKSSRLAFLYMLGYFPEHEAEHKDRNRSNDMWSNLREATHMCNSQNVGVLKSNKTGVTGVSWDKSKNAWRAQMISRGVSLRLGRYKNFDDAVMARLKAEIENDYFLCSTKSSAYEYLKKIKHPALQGLDEWLGYKPKKENTDGTPDK